MQQIAACCFLHAIHFINRATPDISKVKPKTDDCVDMFYWCLNANVDKSMQINILPMRKKKKRRLFHLSVTILHKCQKAVAWLKPLLITTTRITAESNLKRV